MSIKGRRINSRPSLNRIKVGSVLEVRDETTLYFSASFGDLDISILANLRLLLANLRLEKHVNKLLEQITDLLAERHSLG